MSQSFLPQFGMPIVDKNGKASMQLQQFFMRLAQSSAGMKVTVQGQSQTASALSFGNGFTGDFSGTTLDLSTGFDVSNGEADYIGVTNLTFGAGFSVSGSDGAVTVEGGGSSLKIMQNGVVVGTGVDVINVAGNVNAKVEGDELILDVGGIQANSDGGSYSNLVAGPNISLSGDPSGDLTISSKIGVEYSGTLYPTLAAGSNVTLSGSGGTLSFSANINGYAGTYHDMISSRALNTSYTNTSAVQITIFVGANISSGAPAEIFIKVNGTILAAISTVSSDGYDSVVSAPVNPGETYIVGTSNGSWSLISWYERY